MLRLRRPQIAAQAVWLAELDHTVGEANEHFKKNMLATSWRLR